VYLFDTTYQGLVGLFLACRTRDLVIGVGNTEPVIAASLP
jgi:hypothetical protein